jgi:hypothetical protein
MKKIWRYLKQHVREDFTARQYGAVLLFLAVFLFVNYRFDYDYYFLKSQQGFTKYICHFIFYSSAYFFSLLVIYPRSEKTFFSKRIFWIKSIVGLAALSLDSSVPFLHGWINYLFEADLQLWAYKVSINLLGIFTVLLPLLIVYWMYDNKQKHYYGLFPKSFDASPYFYMLLIMLPIMIAASFHPSFQRQYPMYKISDAHEILQIPEWVTVVIYEFVYGFDFVTVEFLFRGFFVIGMMPLLGRHAVLAMATTYCFLHYGKPPGEAISSVFGGYLLGVVAYETKSVWGGVIVHVGIAWMMELIGWAHKS